MSYTPYVIESTSRGEKHYDIFSRLLKDRIIFIGTVITEEVANVIIAQLLFLEMDAPDKDIHLYINSPGGSVSAGLAIYDMMQMVKCDISTYCVGMAASMGSLLLMAGTKGKRHIMPNGHVLIHQPHLGGSGIGGQVTDVEIFAKQLVKTKENVIDIYVKHTGKDKTFLRDIMERDFNMSADDAKEFGIVDKILKNRKK